jgi:GrpB-like predicted nucleotidyltransferase (UPF0157 family)
VSDGIVLVDSDPRWPAMAADEIERIRAAAGPSLVALEHVGSTSVSGLVAKPVIDLQGGVDVLADADALVPRIVAAGYEYVTKYEDEIPRRRFFVRRDAAGVRTHHLHVVEIGSWMWTDRLLFRDHLRDVPDAAERYAKVKRVLAERFAADREGYTMAKTGFIEACLGDARRRVGIRRHAVVVGGTGMLRGATLGLVVRGYDVSVVARNPRRLDDLRAAASGKGGVLRPVCVDYRDADALAFGIDDAARELGPPSLAVAWAHSSAPDAPNVVARALDATGRPAEFFHLLGSAAGDPTKPEEDRGDRFAAFRRLSYHQIVLGFVVEAAGSRWLTDDEIAEGVLRAVDEHAPRRVVGVVEPWSSRP